MRVPVGGAGLRAIVWIGMLLPISGMQATRAGTLGEIDLGRRQRISIGRELAEVSGLARLPDGRLLAHADEVGVVHVLDPVTGRTLERYTLGAPAIKGDFEGIAVAGTRIFLVDSSGNIHDFQPGSSRARVSYRTYVTGLGESCEVEGLAYDRQSNDLLLACKTTRGQAYRNQVVVRAFSLTQLRLRPAPRFMLPYAALGAGRRNAGFHASSIEVHPSGSYYLLGARENLIMEVSRDGSLLSLRELSRNAHPQSEGLAILPDGSLIIADEQGSAAGTLTWYRSAR